MFGSRRQQGRLYLILVLPDGTRSLIPAEWTDLHGPAATATGTSLASVEDLLRNRRVVDAVQRREMDAGLNPNVESARAKQAELHGRRSDSADIDVGSIGRGEEARRHRNAGATDHEDGRGGKQSGAQE